MICDIYTVLASCKTCYVLQYCNTVYNRYCAPVISVNVYCDFTGCTGFKQYPYGSIFSIINIVDFHIHCEIACTFDCEIDVGYISVEAGVSLICDANVGVIAYCQSADIELNPSMIQYSYMNVIVADSNCNISCCIFVYSYVDYLVFAIGNVHRSCVHEGVELVNDKVFHCHCNCVILVSIIIGHNEIISDSQVID